MIGFAKNICQAFIFFHGFQQLWFEDSQPVIAHAAVYIDKPNVIHISDKIRNVGTADKIGIEVEQKWWRTENGSLVTKDPNAPISVTVDLRFILTHELGHALQGGKFSDHSTV